MSEKYRREKSAHHEADEKKGELNAKGRLCHLPHHRVAMLLMGLGAVL